MGVFVFKLGLRVSGSGALGSSSGVIGLGFRGWALWGFRFKGSVVRGGLGFGTQAEGTAQAQASQAKYCPISSY